MFQTTQVADMSLFLTSLTRSRPKPRHKKPSPRQSLITWHHWMLVPDTADNVQLVVGGDKYYIDLSVQKLITWNEDILFHTIKMK